MTFTSRRTAIVSVAVMLIAGASLPAMASAEGSFQRTLQVSGAVNLDIETGSGNVQVRTGGSNQVQITGHVKATSWFDSNAAERVKRIEDNPPIQQSGNDIRVGHISDPDLRRNVSISYEVMVPAQTQLRSHTGSGDQTIDGIGGPAEIESGSGSLKVMNIGNTVRAETGSGSIVVEHVKVSLKAKTGSGSIQGSDIAGGFEGHTGSGHITLDQSAPGSVHAETGSGGMDLRGVKGSLEATAGSGGITVEGDPTGPWSIHTGSGSVHVKVASNAAFDLDARTSSGSLNVAQPITVQGSMGRKEIHGKVNDGGVSVDIETGSGNIDVQ